jgi:cytoskeletal protein CcmA (bactofilin family)
MSMNLIRSDNAVKNDSSVSGSWFQRRDKGDPLQERIDCLIGVGTSLVGDLVFAGGLRIDGRIQGDVTVSNVKSGTLVIGDEGVIEGDIRVSHLIVYGRVLGSVYTTGLVDLRSRAHITGDVHYSLIEMQAGTVIEGVLVPHRPGEAA